MLFCSPPLGIPIILDRLLALTVGYDSFSFFLLFCAVSTCKATQTSALIFIIGAKAAYAKGTHYCAELLLQNDLQNGFNLSACGSTGAGQRVPLLPACRSLLLGVTRPFPTYKG